MNKGLLTILLLCFFGGAFPVNAQQQQMPQKLPSPINEQEQAPRKYLKCYVQLEDKSYHVRGFVYQKEDKETFIENIKGSKFFLEDGVSFLRVEKVVECVDAKADFRNRKAMRLEKITPF
ncbi:TapY2 family type IVa secretion system protein [Psychromonas aquimarina]|uniref:TapY2 family type IVa secretion system protein n=1 Tax=Psychromonas aquimarina TaxID=444919 RepID=UPI00040F8E6B|nr:TapY2 family type IVa secretion system protein [Psychromonas aquimarina]